MAIPNPPITDNNVLDSWTFRATQSINGVESQIDELSNAIVMISPDGTRWRVTIDNNGAFVPVQLT